MLWGGHNGGLEIRRSADGATALRGRFPYGVSTILWDGGRIGQAQKEVIAPRAFATRVEQQDQDIHFLAGHDFDKPLASRAAGSLTLTDSDEALIFEATISPEMFDVSYVRDFLAGLGAGLIIGVSPGFRIAPTDQAESIRSDGDGVLCTVNSEYPLGCTDRSAFMGDFDTTTKRIKKGDCKMAVTLKQVEAIPAIYPGVAPFNRLGYVADEDAPTNEAQVWQRFKKHSGGCMNIRAALTIALRTKRQCAKMVTLKWWRIGRPRRCNYLGLRIYCAHTGGHDHVAIQEKD